MIIGLCTSSPQIAFLPPFPFLFSILTFYFYTEDNLKCNTEGCLGLLAQFMMVYSVVHRTNRNKLSGNSCFFAVFFFNEGVKL